MKIKYIYYCLFFGLLFLIPNDSYGVNVKSDEIDFRKFVNISDIIVMGKVISIGENISNKKGQAVLRIERVIRGKPLGQVIYISFPMPKITTDDTILKFGNKYLIYLDAGEGIKQIYNLVKSNSGQNIGLINEDENTIIFTDTSENFTNYIAKIESHLSDNSYITKNRVDSIFNEVRKGKSIYGSRKKLMLAEINGNSVKPVESLIDIIHNSTIQYLNKYINDESEDIRKSALYILSTIGSDAAASLIIKGLEDSRNSIATKEICLKGLVKARSWKAIPTLINSFSKKVYKNDINNFNYNINQTLWHIIVQRRYIKMAVDSPMVRHWVKIVNYEKLPNYRAYFDLGKIHIKTIAQWQKWQERYYIHAAE